MTRVLVPASETVSLLRRVVGGVAALALLACGESTEPANTGPGALRITVATGGSGRAPGGYTYTLDGGSAQPLPVNGAVTLAGLASGSHSLSVGGLAAGCTLDGANPRAVGVVSGQTTDVALAVTCVSGSLRIMVTTVGGGHDPDAYTYTLDGGAPRALPSSGAVTADSLTPGAHTLAIGGLADGCTAAENPRSVTVTGDVRTEVVVVVRCVAAHPRGEVYATVPTGTRAYGVAISAAGVVYVANLDASSVSRADLPSTTLAPRVAVGSLPSHVAFNPAGTTAYVANQGSQNVSVVDVATNTQTATIPVSSDAWNVIVSPDGRRLYATTDRGALFVVNTADHTVVTSLTLREGDALRGLAFGPGGRVLYVAGRNSGNVYAIDTETNTVARTIALGGILQRLAVSRDGTELYVANEVRGLEVVTLATGAARTIALGGAYGLALSPDNASLYVTIPAAGLVHEVDRATGAIVRTIAVGGRPRVVAFTRAGDVAVIANEAGWVTFVR